MAKQRFDLMSDGEIVGFAVVDVTPQHEPTFQHVTHQTLPDSMADVIFLVVAGAGLGLAGLGLAGPLGASAGLVTAVGLTSLKLWRTAQPEPEPEPEPEPVQEPIRLEIQDSPGHWIIGQLPDRLTESDMERIAHQVLVRGKSWSRRSLKRHARISEESYPLLSQAFLEMGLIRPHGKGYELRARGVKLLREFLTIDA